MPRLLLIRHATTASTRRAAFPATSGRAVDPACEPLDAAGRAAAAALGRALPRVDRCWTSHAVRALETAGAMGLTPDVRMPELAEGDFGVWAGQTLDEVHASDPDGLAGWFADLTTAPHGGEPLADVTRRAATVLAAAADADGTTVAVSHSGLIRAVLLEVLDLPAPMMWRLEVTAPSVTELHPGSGGWRLVRLNWTPRLVARPTAAAPGGDAAEDAP